jgi:hypothetical protein
MFGVLIAIFRFNRVALQGGIARKRNVPLIVPGGIPGRAILTLPRGRILAVVWRPSSLRPLVPVPHFIHA